MGASFKATCKLSSSVCLMLFNASLSTYAFTLDFPKMRLISSRTSINSYALSSSFFAIRWLNASSSFLTLVSPMLCSNSLMAWGILVLFRLNRASGIASWISSLVCAYSVLTPCSYASILALTSQGLMACFSSAFSSVTERLEISSPTLLESSGLVDKTSTICFARVSSCCATLTKLSCIFFVSTFRSLSKPSSTTPSVFETTLSRAPLTSWGLFWNFATPVLIASMASWS